MKTKSLFLTLTAFLFLLSGCKSYYSLTQVSRTRMLVDSRYIYISVKWRCRSIYITG